MTNDKWSCLHWKNITDHDVFILVIIPWECNIVLAPNMTQNAERKLRTQDTDTAQ